MLRRIPSSTNLSSLTRFPSRPSMKMDPPSGFSNLPERAQRGCDSSEALITRHESITCDALSPSSSVTGIDATSSAQPLPPVSLWSPHAPTIEDLPLDHSPGEEDDFGTRRIGCGARQQTVLESQDISYYRPTASKQVMDLAEIPSGAPCPIDEASCSHSQVAMWHRTAGTEGGGSHASSSSLSICDMLCGVSSRIVDNVSEEMRTEDLLRMHHRIPHTIVLDSHQPELAPHIVITPPDDSVIETWHAVNSNRPNPLDSSYLMPLPFYGLGLYPPPATLLHPSAKTSDEPQSYNRITGVPLVFSHRVFRLSIIMSTEERLSPFTRNITFSLYRHLFKSIAIIASERAENFRSRYDSPSFCETIERPFEWTDPAEAVISMYNRNFSNGKIILHSVEPFTIPHIIIHEAPPNDPWVIFANGTNVQDCSFGNSLVAPSSRFRPLRYANLPGYAIDQYSVDSCREDDDYFDDDASSTDSVCPSTPTAPSMELDVFKAQSPAIANAADDDETAFGTSNVLWDVDRNRVKHLFFIDEDEDDGPPEWDDWFEAAASRARDVETSNS